MTRATVLVPVIALLLATIAHAEPCTPPGLDPGPHAVGYRVDHRYDQGRSFGPRRESDGTAVSRPPWRPVQVHLWYPARDGSGSAMRYRDYLVTVASLGYPVDDAGADPASVVDHWKRGPRRRDADEAKLDELLGQTMRARRDARPAPGAFPLVIYSPSINSDPSENAALFEWLASWGYVVASAPSMGRDEIDVSRDHAGARAQLEDLRFVLATAAAEPFVDAERLAAVGFSWGGMAALLLTLDHAAIQAVVSLDGGHRFPDYEPVAASFPGWSAQRLRAALLEISLADEPRVVSLGEAARYADVHLWSQPGLLHRDFSWDLIARYRHATGDADYERVRTIYGEWTQAVKAFLDAQLANQDGRWNRFAASGPRSEGASWSSRTGSDPPPTPAQLAAMAEQQGVDAVIELVHRYRAADPDLLPYEENRMIGFVYTWGPERADELQRLLELNLELYPRSATTHVWLAQVHLARDDRDRALASLEAALALDPEHERARRLLERLRPSDD